MEALRLYSRFIGVAIRSRMEYRSDFLVGIVSVIVLNYVNLTLIWVLVNQFRALQGWSLWEIVMLYAVWTLSHSIHAVFFWHVTTLEDDILSGRFDQYLVRPCSPLVQYLGKEVNYMGVADAVFAISAFLLAYVNLALDWAPWKWAFLVVAILSGTAIESGIAWICGSLAFWTGRSSSIFYVTLRFNILTQQYPIDVFGRWFRAFVTGFLPVAFVNYFPLTVLLIKMPAIGPPWIGYLSPVVAIFVVSVGAIVWSRGVTSYASSGN